MANNTPKAKPYKLKPSNGIMTRDDVAMWEYTLLAACRQVAVWRQFLPGQPNENWTATDEDVTNGLEVIDENGLNEEQTDELRRNFADFLTCVATHCPSGFMDTVMRESTSFKEIVKQIQVTYGLQSRGEKFLNCIDIKFEFNDTFTYEMGYMKIKDFFMSSLLSTGSIFKGRNMNAAETLSPLAENFIMKEFLEKVHPKLPEHVKNTKGYLFTDEKPTLACNKSKLIDLMDTMLQEIDNLDNVNTGVISMGQVRSGYRGYARGRYNPNRGFPNRGGQVQFRGTRPPFSNTNNRFQGNRFRRDCINCLEARRFDSSRGHDSSQCPFIGAFQQRDSVRPNFKVLLVHDRNSNQQVNSLSSTHYPDMMNNNTYEEVEEIDYQEPQIYEHDQQEDNEYYLNQSQYLQNQPL